MIRSLSMLTGKKLHRMVKNFDRVKAGTVKSSMEGNYSGYLIFDRTVLARNDGLRRSVAKLCLYAPEIEITTDKRKCKKTISYKAEKNKRYAPKEDRKEKLEEHFGVSF